VNTRGVPAVVFKHVVRSVRRRVLRSEVKEEVPRSGAGGHERSKAWRLIDPATPLSEKKKPRKAGPQDRCQQKTQANTPAVSSIRADTSPRWYSVSPKVNSSWVSFLK